jgi:hypothetical protein
MQDLLNTLNQLDKIQSHGKQPKGSLFKGMETTFTNRAKSQFQNLPSTDKEQMLKQHPRLCSLIQSKQKTIKSSDGKSPVDIVQWAQKNPDQVKEKGLDLQTIEKNAVSFIKKLPQSEQISIVEKNLSWSLDHDELVWIAMLSLILPSKSQSAKL